MFQGWPAQASPGRPRERLRSPPGRPVQGQGEVQEMATTVQAMLQACPQGKGPPL